VQGPALAPVQGSALALAPVQGSALAPVQGSALAPVQGSVQVPNHHHRSVRHCRHRRTLRTEVAAPARRVSIWNRPPSQHLSSSSLQVIEAIFMPHPGFDDPSNRVCAATPARASSLSIQSLSGAISVA
jgi:hypothetical protein